MVARQLIKFDSGFSAYNSSLIHAFPCDEMNVKMEVRLENFSMQEFAVFGIRKS